MPADPSNAGFADFVNQFQAQFRQAQKTDGWWNYVEQNQVRWIKDFNTVVETGLFFKAARYNQQVYCFSSHRFLKIPADSKDPRQAATEEAKKLYEELNKELAKFGLSKLVVSLRTKGNNYKDLLLHSKDSYLFFDTEVQKEGRRLNLSAASFSEDTINVVRKIVTKYVEFRTLQPDLHIISDNAEGGLELRSIGRPGTPLIRENYNEQVLFQYDYIKHQLSRPDPFGRLVVLHGKAGTGKTNILKSLLYELKMDGNCKFISLQPDYLFKLSMPSLTRLFLDAVRGGNKLILFIEDGDDCLVSRGQDNMPAIHALLNLADGFVGNLLDVRVVVTTNAKSFDIDPALKRPGRLCRIISVDPLSMERANKAYQCISGKDDFPFDQDVVLASVYEKAYQVLGSVSADPIIAEDSGAVTARTVGFRE